jgi:LAO/AO transport system kinase
MTLLQRFRDGDIRALSRLISHVENRSKGYRDLLGELYKHTGRAVRIGITGPPGAGKSTLVNCLAHSFVSQQKKAAVIAVDPSSPFTGGALLGDRVRMNEFSPNGGVYFRSMATRGAAGGLAGATDNVAATLDAFGYDIILIETVGVGQIELDIVDACDSVVVVVVPESGDAVQTMKAGLIEIGDLFVVNKADRLGADRMADDLISALEVQRHRTDWDLPVIQTVAVKNKNIEALVSALQSHQAIQRESGRFAIHRREQMKKKILNIVRNRFQREFLDRFGEPNDVDAVLSNIEAGKTNPFVVAERLYAAFRDKQRG